MGDTWIVDLSVFLDEEGNLMPPGGPGRRVAEHMCAIVAMASWPELVIPASFHVRCRRRPGRKPCTGMIEFDWDPENDDIEWWCPVCQDNGRISNWRGTLWDMTEADEWH